MPAEVPFQYWVRLMVLCGRIAGVLNGRRGRIRTLVASAVDGGGGLGGLQSQLVAFYADLPPAMKWGVDNFRVQEGRGHGGTYLTLHLWANAVMALVYHPELLSSPSGMETPLSQNMDRSIKLSLSSSRTISECLVFADLFSSQSYVCSFSSWSLPRMYSHLCAVIQSVHRTTHIRCLSGVHTRHENERIGDGC